jgi:Flp pilus assembly protein TadG
VSGSVALLFAFLILSLSAGMVLAIDYSRALRSKEIIDKAADAANLAAAKAAAEIAGKTPGKSLGQIKSEAEAIGLRFFQSNMNGNAGFAMNRHTMKVREVNGEWIATTEYEATSQNTLAALIGPEALQLAGTSSASITSRALRFSISRCASTRPGR